MTRTGKSRDLIGENAYHVTGSLNSAASVDDVFLYIIIFPLFRSEENDPGKALHTSKKIKGRPTNIRRFCLSLRFTRRHQGFDR
jgi:hypothetical protein